MQKNKNKINRIKPASFFLIYIWVSFAACTSQTEPGEIQRYKGLYERTLFSESQLKFVEDVVYSTRTNLQLSVANGKYPYWQYTSGTTEMKEQELKQAKLNMAMDIILPPNAAMDKKQPLLIFVHGGNFLSGDKRGRETNFVTYARAGYVTATINYRLTDNNMKNSSLRMQAILSAQEDMQNAIRFLKKNAELYCIDTTRMSIMGSSAGGATTLIAAVEYDNPMFVNDYTGFSAKVQASISTGATLVNEDSGDGQDLLHFDSYDVPVLMFFAKPQDPKGPTWDGNAVPTKALFDAAGIPCILEPHLNGEHTVDLKVGGNYWGKIKPFIWQYLKIDELLNHP